MTGLSTVWSMLIAAALTATGFEAGATEFRVAGFLGNSGTAARPLRFAPDVPGAGVAYDEREGLFYLRTGVAEISALTEDGRLHTRHPLPGATRTQPGDRIARCGGFIVILAGADALYVLPLNAPDGAPARRAGRCGIDRPVMLGGSAHAGKIAVTDAAGRVFRFDPAAGTAEQWGTLPPDFRAVSGDFTPEGDLALLERYGKTVRVLRRDRSVPGEPQTILGPRTLGLVSLCRSGEFFYGGADGGTVQRFDRNFRPAPGIILGGASGYNISTVHVDCEAAKLRNLAEIQPGVFAFSGDRGALLIGHFDAAEGKMRLRKRFGSVPPCRAVEFDAAGRVLAGNLVWNRADAPDAPAALTFRDIPLTPLAGGNADGVRIAPGLHPWRKPALYLLRPGATDWKFEVNAAIALPLSPIGAARTGRTGRTLVTVNAGGDATAVEFSPDSPHKVWGRNQGAVRFRAAKPLRRWTALRNRDDTGRLLAAADGFIVEFMPDGENAWRERTRWSDGFGPDLTFATDGGRILIGDRANGRVALYELDSHRKLAERRISAPGAVALRGNFAAVYETDNQRIAILEVR